MQVRRHPMWWNFNISLRISIITTAFVHPGSVSRMLCNAGSRIWCSESATMSGRAEITSRFSDDGTISKNSINLFVKSDSLRRLSSQRSLWIINFEMQSSLRTSQSRSKNSGIFSKRILINSGWMASIFSKIVMRESPGCEGACEVDVECISSAGFKLLRRVPSSERWDSNPANAKIKKDQVILHSFYGDLKQIHPEQADCFGNGDPAPHKHPL